MGKLTFESGFWSGSIADRDRSILVSCGGDPVSPSEPDLERLKEVWAARDFYFDEAIKFLAQNELERAETAKCSTPCGISIELWGRADCVIEMLDPDEETIWRVGFEKRRAIAHGFDH